MLLNWIADTTPAPKSISLYDPTSFAESEDERESATASLNCVT